MKVLPFKIPKAKNIGLIYQEDRGISFYDKLHQHEEIQICYIVKGEGSLIVGDAVNDYCDNTILVIGGNQPHVFKSDTSIIKKSFMMSLFFTKESFGNAFFDLDDFKELEYFFNNAKTSFKITNNSEELISCFKDLPKSDDFERFIIFLKIIKLILKSDIERLSTFLYTKKYTDNEGKRMGKVMDYTLNNYSKKIDLEEVSEVANMTPNAFCRYFKQRTNKTYFTFLNEIRVEKACKLLQNKEYLITEISEKSGFKNISNFNRKFKEIKGFTPSDYRANY
ncbi:AraC family transcriptional regulator [Tenacibaculum halocynthiae]|uniref:AraC family transcriptional regulator n=1 Tax=Tenacibaculum halocynthiae TaxID=1254437 RepID=UPI003893536E